MTDEAKPGWGDRIKACLDISLAAKTTIVVGGLMWIAAGVVWMVYALDSTRVAWGDYMSAWRGICLLVLWVVSCIATYVTVRLWMHEIPIRNPHMKAGWEAGMQLLSDHGKRIRDVPCFVVLGSPTRHDQDRWSRSQGTSTRPIETSETASIDWHLRDDCLLVFLRQAGVYAKVASRNVTSGLPAVDVSRDTPTAILDGDHHQPRQPEDASPMTPPPMTPPSPPSESIDDTPATESIAPGLGLATSSSTATVTLPASTKSATASSAAYDSLRRLDEASGLLDDAQAIAIPTRMPAMKPALTSMETTDGQESLIEFCTRLRAARYPHSPINGALVMLNCQSMGDDEDSARQVGRSIQRDLDVLANELGVECATSILLAEYDRGHDYDELSQQLFARNDSLPLIGLSMSPEERLSVDAISGLADKTVDQIQQHLHSIRDVKRSTAPCRDSRLIRILIRCRRLRDRLRSTLIQCVSVASNEDRTISCGSRMLTGIFLASPDGGTDRASYFDAIVDRLVAQQNHLAWTPASLKMFDWQRRCVQTLILVCVMQLIALIFQVHLAVTNAGG